MRRFSTRLAFVALALAFFAFATPSRAQTVRVTDASGRTTYSARMVPMGAGAWGVPLETYEKLGLYARLWRDGRPVVAIRDSDSGIFLPINGRRVLTFLHEQPLPKRYDHPVAVRRNGRVYVAGYIVTGHYHTMIRARYDARRKIVTLQPRP